MLNHQPSKLLMYELQYIQSKNKNDRLKARNYACLKQEEKATRRLNDFYPFHDP